MQILRRSLTLGMTILLGGCGTVTAASLAGPGTMAAYTKTETVRPNTPSKFGGYGALLDPAATALAMDADGADASDPGVDLRAKFPPVASQGVIAASTAFALTGFREYLGRKENGRSVSLSPRYLYYVERQMLERRDTKAGAKATTKDTGAYLADGMQVLATTGVCTEASAPWATATDMNRWQQLTLEGREAAIGRFLSVPATAAMATEAKAFKLNGTVRKLTRLSALKQALQSGIPAVMTLAVYDSFESDTASRTGRIPLPNTKKEQRLGYQAVCVVGYDDEAGHLIVRNSWGVKWGDGGYGYVSYDYVAKGLAFEALTIR